MQITWATEAAPTLPVAANPEPRLLFVTERGYKAEAAIEAGKEWTASVSLENAEQNHGFKPPSSWLHQGTKRIIGWMGK